MEACDVFVGMTTASGAAIYNNRLKELMNEKKARGSIHLLKTHRQLYKRRSFSRL